LEEFAAFGSFEESFKGLDVGVVTGDFGGDRGVAGVSAANVAFTAVEGATFGGVASPPSARLAFKGVPNWVMA
jgi:hypothetical protein